MNMKLFQNLSPDIGPAADGIPSSSPRTGKVEVEDETEQEPKVKQEKYKVVNLFKH